MSEIRVLDDRSLLPGKYLLMLALSNLADATCLILAMEERPMCQLESGNVADIVQRRPVNPPLVKPCATTSLESTK